LVDVDKIQTDFDRLAAFDGDGWNHNNHYHDFLLRQIPPRCEYSLEIGCGTGTFARLLAKCSQNILALDLSPQMIVHAKERSSTYPNIDYKAADVMAYDLPDAQFDCIVSIATLHHVSIEEALPKIKRALKVNGRLMVLDLFEAETIREKFIAAFGVPYHLVLKRLHHGRLREPDEAHAAWEEHGRSDVYLTLSQLRQICDTHLPQAKIRQHLLWRYSLI